MNSEKKKFRLKVPNTYLLIFSLLILIAALTWIIPGGEYETTTLNGREVVVQNSFKYVENEPQGIFAIFIAPLKGFVKAGMIIGFILLVGGAFNVLAKTDAINSLIYMLAKAYRKSNTLRKLFVPVLIFMFSIGGATFGMNEEIIPFVLIIVPICLALGYDSIVGVAIPSVGAHIGFASAFLNPFNVGIAQGIADVPIFSGIGYRIICWLISTLVAILFILYYLKRPRPYTSREFIREIGRWLAAGNSKKKDSLIQRAFEKDVPIFVPAFSDCSAGFGIVKHQVERRKAKKPYVTIDSGGDFRELTEIKLAAGTTALFMIGGGVPKNFAQDTDVCAEILGHEDVEMHKYAVQITVTDVRDGACSSSTLKEAASWGKVSTVHEQMVFAEATSVAAHCVRRLASRRLEKA